MDTNFEYVFENGFISNSKEKDKLYNISRYVEN